MLRFSNKRQAIKECPCGKSNKDGKFVPYIIEGQVSNSCGFCHACGDTFLPSLDRKEINNQGGKTKVIPLTITQKLIDFTIVQKTLKAYSHNNFVIWLEKIVPNQVEYLLACFNIGTAKDGGTLFWNINIHNQATTVKRVYYLENGHRDKNKLPEYIYKRSDGYLPCLFGEFQLTKRPYDYIILVESEKTAVVGTAIIPQFIWIATGGANGLTEEKAIVLKGRKVIIIYDCDNGGRKGAMRASEILKSYYCQVHIEELDVALQDGTDVVDMILK